jgi:signal transduction histidine kinase
MPHQSLGLFDTPPSRRDVRLALLVLGLLFVAFLVILPFRDVSLPEVRPFVPMLDSITLVGEAIVGTMLYAQAAIYRSLALTVLASGYVFGTLMIFPHALTFPGAFNDHGLFGAGFSTAAWLATFWYWSFPSAAIAYVFVDRADSKKAEVERPPPHIRRGLLATIVLAGLAIFVTTQRPEVLPPLFVNRYEMATNLLVFDALLVGLPLAGAILLGFKSRSVLELWLFVALAGYSLEAILQVTSAARFTLGWYANWAYQLSDLLVLLALLAESTRMQVRLAISMAEKEREREARRISINALASALIREIGQPLAAMRLSNSVGLTWLSKDVPDTAKATQAIRAAMDAGDLTFQVLNDVRTLIPRSSEPLEDINLNDLVRDVLVLLHAELASKEIRIELDLFDELPKVRGRRTQLREVVVHLLMNAIESFEGSLCKFRVIAISSAVENTEWVKLEVTDTGRGIARDELEHIFDPFVTSKSDGIGLGLTVSRTIIEDHGGRLWVESNDRHGVNFHISIRAAS